jgi:hypothetical protein
LKELKEEGSAKYQLWFDDNDECRHWLLQNEVFESVIKILAKSDDDKN